MSDLSAIEKRKLEKTLAMGDGYVLNFSNRTFADYFMDVAGVDIYDRKYDRGGSSKANRMRAFWDQESNYLVAKVLGPIFDNWEDFAPAYDGHASEPPEECPRIIQRLREAAPISDLSMFETDGSDATFDALAKQVRQAIERDEPEEALDRLHTYLVKYFRKLCEKHGLEATRDKPLHSLVGEYVKALKREGAVESEVTERILKSSISVMEAFNTVRNEHSLAHDNKMLNYNESLLIFGHVASSVRFIESIEAADAEDDGDDDGYMPF